nr:MAG TPA: penicillin-binding protein [Caudoviricetes sp.]
MLQEKLRLVLFIIIILLKLIVWRLFLVQILM